MTASQIHEREISAKNAAATTVVSTIAATHKMSRDANLAIKPPNAKPHAGGQ
jgi:hypothetical protein